MKYIILIAFLSTLFSGCSALPMDGSVLETIKGRPKGEVAQAPDVCNCEVQVTCH